MSLVRIIGSVLLVKALLSVEAGVMRRLGRQCRYGVANSQSTPAFNQLLELILFEGLVITGSSQSEPAKEEQWQEPARPADPPAPPAPFGFRHSNRWVGEEGRSVAVGRKSQLLNDAGHMTEIIIIEMSNQQMLCTTRGPDTALKATCNLLVV